MSIDCAKRDMSRAVLTCKGSCRPDALRKRVRVMPILRALRVIIRANLLSDPPSFSPNATATSFADFVTNA